MSHPNRKPEPRAMRSATRYRGPVSAAVLLAILLVGSAAAAADHPYLLDSSVRHSKALFDVAALDSRAPRPSSATTYHVATTGSDGNPGTESRPFRTVQKAVGAVAAGDTIKVHAGTYDGVVVIRKSGSKEGPIVLMAAGDGEATLSAAFPKLDCGKRSPTAERTVQILGGADDWTIRDLSVVNGIVIQAPGKQVLENRNFSDRTLPGHGAERDSAGAEKVLGSFGIDPSDRIHLINLDIRGRGLLTIGARHGELANSRIHDIDCGTGAGAWFNRFSDFWNVHDNHVYNVAASEEHYMSEGIRLGSGSSYNLVERNVVEHLQGPGRGITADVGASWNTYRANRVDDAAINFSEQAAGWGNQYLFNVSQNARRVGYQVYGVGGMDEARREAAKLRRKGPSKTSEPKPEGNSTPRFLLYQCNDSRNDPIAFSGGAFTESKFLDNNFPTARLSEKLLSAWQSSRNVWDGSGGPPPAQPSTASFGSCRAAAGT